MAKQADGAGPLERRLGKTTLFSVVAKDTQALSVLAALCRRESFPAGHTVVREGETDDRMFILGSGTVEVRKRTPHGDVYTVSTLCERDENCFGEVALIEDDVRTASVVCVSDCDMYVISRREFLELGERDPRLGLLITRQIAAILCHRLRKADNDIVTLFSALVSEVAESGGLHLE